MRTGSRRPVIKIAIIKFVSNLIFTTENIRPATTIEAVAPIWRYAKESTLRLRCSLINTGNIWVNDQENMQVTNNTNKENIKTGEVLTNFNVSWNSFTETFSKLNTVIFFEEREPVLDTKIISKPHIKNKQATKIYVAGIP